jgi:hypothetical protein
MGVRAHGDFQLSEPLRILRITHVDDRSAERALHVPDIGDALVDHDLAAAGTIEPADLAHAFC